MDDAISVRYAGLVQQLIATSQVAIKKDDPTDKLTYLRLRTKQNEILVIPGKLLSVHVRGQGRLESLRNYHWPGQLLA